MTSEPYSLCRIAACFFALLTCAPVLAQNQALPESRLFAETTDLSAVLWSLPLVLLCVIASGAFAMAETALVALRPSRVEQLVEEARRGASGVKRLAENPSRYLATAQVGITLLGFAAVAVSSVTLAPWVAERLFGSLKPGVRDPLSLALVTLTLSLLSIALGELAPKSQALQAPDVWALRLAPFVNGCALLFAPLSGIALGLSRLIVPGAKFETPMMTREEFAQLVDETGRRGEIDDEEAEIISNIVGLSETTARAVMTPRVDMTAVEAGAAWTEVLQAAMRSGHSRIPIFEGTIDNIVGVVHAKDLLPLFFARDSAIDLRHVMRSAPFVSETARIDDLLEQMRRSNVQLAIVQDEYAGTAGLVTIEDLLEEIVGDIRDEHDKDEPEVRVLSETETLFDARVPIDEVAERLGIELADDAYDTIGGFVFGRLGHEPEPGDRLQVEQVEFVVEETEGTRIRRLRAIRLPEPESPL